jgi:hypothetical protein
VSSSQPHAGALDVTAGAVGVALLRRALGDLSDEEAAIADDAILRGIRALPDSTRPGVVAAAALCRAVLLVAGRADFLTLPTDRQMAVVDVLTTRPLPAVMEFVKLTRGLALVAVVDHRDRATGVR